MARGPARRAEALVLDRTKLGETDLIITLLAREGELLKAVAKGARKPGARLSAPTELYGRVDALLAPGKSLWILTDGRRLVPPARRTDDMAGLSAAAAVSEVVRASLPEGEADPFVYALVLRAFEEIALAGDVEHLDLVSAATAMKLLSHLGWQPGLDACVGCGSRETTHASVSAGGLLCDGCAGEAEDAESVDARRAAWLRSLIGARLADLAAAPVDGPTAAWLASFARNWAAYHLDARLRAFDFLLSF